jgi:hypothetical protein
MERGGVSFGVFGELRRKLPEPHGGVPTCLQSGEPAAFAWSSAVEVSTLVRLRLLFVGHVSEMAAEGRFAW